MRRQRARRANPEVAVVTALHESVQAQPKVQFSIVSAVYNVARYLDGFIDSIDAQTLPAERFEVIAVDDGSTDESLDKLHAWQARRPGLVTVLSKANSGQAAARNAGMSVARGAWVTFPDPDDVLDERYLAEVAEFLERHPTTIAVATKFLMLDDASGKLTDSHPLRRRFEAENLLRDLTQFPGHFFGSAPAGFFRASVIRELGLTFDTRIRPHFEDGHFCGRYLLAAERPLVGFVSSALYHYRKRQDQSSTLQKSLIDPGRYTDVPRYGYLELLKAGKAASGGPWPPEWLQNIILYELSWYFSTQDRPSGAVTGAIGPVADEFHALVGQILEHISPDVIASFSARPLKPEWREILLHAYRPEPWHSRIGHLAALDDDQRLVNVLYRYTGDPPSEELLSGGQPVAAVHSKVRDIDYHGRVLLHERIVWMSSRRSVRVRLEGRALDLQFPLTRPNLAVSSATLRRALDPDEPGGGLNAPASKPFVPASRKGRLFSRLATSRPVRRIFRDAWVLMDRIHDAGDSGEILFSYLRAARPDINAWFVVEADTPDWERLRRVHGRRVVAHGSLRWKALMANCRHLISSHADVPVMRPPELHRLMRPRWRFTFLQHGVIKDDLSNWLNPKPIDLFVTSTPQELASIVADHTGYVFTTREVKLTGLPRFDRLREVAAAVPDGGRDLVLVAPTWRSWLVAPLERGSQRRMAGEELVESEFVRTWSALLASPELADACRAEGVTIAFLPHPNLQSALPMLNLPPIVQAHSFDEDVQQLFARAAVLVTDYSSMAFNAAYLDRPVVYFQFDRERMLAGEHVGHPGYFEYGRDGFGPVTSTVEEAAGAVVAALRAGRAPAPEYQRRIDATFPMRDGRCCQRVVEEIERSARPHDAGATAAHHR